MDTKDTEIMKAFSERLKELLKDYAINASKLSKDIGIGNSATSFWINGIKKISYRNFIKVADYFNCTMDFLAGRSYDDMKFIPQTPPPFSVALKRALKACGKSRHYLDKHTKFKDSYLHNWYHGAEPDIVSLVELADILGCTIDFLVGREK